MSLKWKFLFFFLLVSNIPIIIITIFTYDRYTNLVEDRISQIAENVFEKAVDEANEAIDNIDHIAEIFSFYSETSDSIVDELKQYRVDDGSFTSYDVFRSNQNIKFICSNLMFNADYINCIYVFTPSGVTLGYGYGGNIDLRYDYSPFEDDWYNETLSFEGKTLVKGITSKPFLINAKPSISFSRALYDVYTHEFLGVLFVDCKPEIFSLDNVNTLPDTTLLSIENTETNYTLYSNIENFDDDFIKGDKQILKTSLELEPLVLTAVTDYNRLYKEFGSTRVLIIMIALICSGIFIVISLILSNAISEPILFLSNKMAKYKGHSLVITEKYLARNDEIGILCNEYNNMIEELNDFIKQEYQNKLVTLDSQMKSLEAQINSHFLYNTLESINSIAELEEVDSISIMSMALGNMFRYSIKTKSELVTIRQEIQHISDYVSIQSIRFDERFDLINEIPEHLLQAKVLKLILQPIVENALYHGLNYCNSGDTILLKASVTEPNIFITISDNGVGMNDHQLNELRDKLSHEAQFTELGSRNKQSIGLKNIHSRIELYYGKGYGLSVISNLGKGTSITIKLPYIL